MTRRLKQVAVGSIALVGDASGTADAITGEGMGMAFRQALLLAECFEIGDFNRYNRLHPAILQLPQTMSRVMLLMDRSEAFRNRALRMLATEPEIFARMLGVHLGSESLARFVVSRGLEVAWRLMVQPAAVPGVPRLNRKGSLDGDHGQRLTHRRKIAFVYSLAKRSQRRIQLAPLRVAAGVGGQPCWIGLDALGDGDALGHTRHRDRAMLLLRHRP